MVRRGAIRDYRNRSGPQSMCETEADAVTAVRDGDFLRQFSNQSLKSLLFPSIRNRRLRQRRCCCPRRKWRGQTRLDRQYRLKTVRPIGCSRRVYDAERQADGDTRCSKELRKAMSLNHFKGSNSKTTSNISSKTTGFDICGFDLKSCARSHHNNSTALLDRRVAERSNVV